MDAQFLTQLNAQYQKLHTTKEDLFWDVRMGNATDRDSAQKKLDEAEIALQQFRQDAAHLKSLRELQKNAHLSADERILSDGWIQFFSAHTIENADARAASTALVELEGKLESARTTMSLGYRDPKTGAETQASSNLLSNMLRVEKEESMRRAAFEGLQTIETFALQHGFLDIVRQRNKIAHLLGYEDYYDMKVRKAEGLSKKELFTILDDLEIRTRESAQRAVDDFVKTHGAHAREPWNFSFLRSGSITREMDPYYPFAQSLKRWVLNFSRLGVRYRGAKLTLDLFDRKGKYENGFMHAPVPCYYKEGNWQPARIGFTANALPNAVGAGTRALETLFHEGGHAAHFSNILMNGPCFSQEYAPTSVAYAETQSMFFDSLISDADWQMRYGHDESGNPPPLSLVERAIEVSQPYRSLEIRSMLTVCYAEKMLYETPSTELTAEKVLREFRAIEQRMQFLNGSPRPTLAVPHLLSGESSAYYHGYVLAEMAVFQTRDYFTEKYGTLLDNPAIGKEMAECLWKPGNSARFYDLIKELTGKPLNADAIVRYAARTIDEAKVEVRKKRDSVAGLPNPSDSCALDAQIDVVHGKEVITSLSPNQNTLADIERASREFVAWVARTKSLS
jgi:Zn-dependent oligopeptidase